MDDIGRSASPLNLHLHHLAYLRAVARAGSVTRAAEALHVSQPALSQALAELERRLGAPLFERAGRRRSLTPAGVATLTYAESALAGAEALHRTLGTLARGERGLLRAGMIDAGALYVLPEAIRRFRAHHPGVDLQVMVDSSGELLRRLRAHDLDLALVVDAASELDLTVEEITREPLRWYAPVGEETGPADAHWALYPEGSRTRRIIDEGFARAGIRPKVTLESGNPAVLRGVVAAGLGWSVLPPAVAEEGGGLRRGRRLAQRPLHVATRAAAPPDVRVAAFLRLAREPAPRPAGAAAGAR